MSSTYRIISATHCRNTLLQHVAATHCCNTLLQHTSWVMWYHLFSSLDSPYSALILANTWPRFWYREAKQTRRPATHCHARPCTAIYFNTLQRTATHCHALQHAATRCYTLLHAATHCNTHCNALQHAATLCWVATLSCPRTRHFPPINPANQRLFYGEKDTTVTLQDDYKLMRCLWK